MSLSICLPYPVTVSAFIICSGLNTYGRNVSICGDFNFQYHNTRCNIADCELLHFTKCQYYHKTIRESKDNIHRSPLPVHQASSSLDSFPPVTTSDVIALIYRYIIIETPVFFNEYTRQKKFKLILFNQIRQVKLKYIRS